MAFPRIEIYPRARPLTGDEDFVVSQGGVLRKTSTDSISTFTGLLHFPAASAPTTTLANGTPVGVDSSGHLVKCDAGVPATLPFVGFYLDGPLVDVKTTGIYETTGLTPGAPYYVAIGGGITATAPAPGGAAVQRIGVALTATQLFIQPGIVVINAP
jgi:hypothetical protein